MRLLSAIVCMLALGATGAARAGECPGNPDAIGTSRVIVVDPAEHTRLGTMQYRETLPLQDHEVVLTFDDGPLPPYTTRALDILASQCVKATYFLVGRMAQSFPDAARRIYAAGHTIGTHSQTHPLTFHRMPLEQAEQEVQQGIASVSAALGDPADVAPFFRIPGLLRADAVEQYLASQQLMTWSADFPADDWKHIQASEIIRRAINRLEAKGRGVLLLHDIQPATVRALPGLLNELKRRGYHIVHVQPATPDRPKTETLASQWFLHGSGSRPDGNWPHAVPVTIAMLLLQPALPAPNPESFGIDHPSGRDMRVVLPPPHPPRLARGAIPLPPRSIWPREPEEPSAPITVQTVLPVPSPASFGYGGGFDPRAMTAPQKRAALEPAPQKHAAREAAPRAIGTRLAAPDLRGAARSKPGGWPVTTGAMPRSAFP